MSPSSCSTARNTRNERSNLVPRFRVLLGELRRDTSGGEELSSCVGRVFRGGLSVCVEVGAFRFGMVMRDSDEGCRSSWLSVKKLLGPDRQFILLGSDDHHVNHTHSSTLLPPLSDYPIDRLGHRPSPMPSLM